MGKQCHECLASAPLTLLSGVGGRGCHALGQPSALTVLCPRPHRTPLERGQVSLWNLAFSVIRVRCHPGSRAWAWPRRLPALPTVLGPRLPSASTATSREPSSFLMMPCWAWGQGPACRGSPSLRPRGGPELQPRDPEQSRQQDAAAATVLFPLSPRVPVALLSIAWDATRAPGQSVI